MHLSGLFYGLMRHCTSVRHYCLTIVQHMVGAFLIALQLINKHKFKKRDHFLMFSSASNIDQFIFKYLSKFFLTWANKIGMTISLYHLSHQRSHQIKLLLLLLSHFSHVLLCATPEMAAHQAPPSLGFSRQEYWSGLPFPSPVHESEKWKWSRSVVSDSERTHGPQPTRLLHPWDFPGKSTGGGAIAFSTKLNDRIKWFLHLFQ